VAIALLDESSNTVAGTSADSNGDFELTDFPPGNYVIIESNPDGCDDVTSTVGASKGDSTDNIFVDERLGWISGNVSKDADNDNLGESHFSTVVMTF